MARYKNALTKYEIAEIPSSSSTDPTYYELAKFISSVEPNDNESTEDEGFYDGDGNPETTVMSQSLGYTFSGYDDPDDPAQMIVRAKKYTVGDDRKVLFKVTETGTGAKVLSGTATITEIVSGSAGGEATEFATFGCNITFDGTPTVADVPTSGSGVG